jgi:hypothetical protein
MFSRTLHTALLALLALWPLPTAAHTIITYPGWRGDNLITNSSFPYGMQWMYPCGGMPTSTNRTLWPVSGGAIAIQPGWFPGHATAFFYINLGLGGGGGPDPLNGGLQEVLGGPPNMSFPMVPVFQITGPSKGPYPGGFCLPQVPLPANVRLFFVPQPFPSPSLSFLSSFPPSSPLLSPLLSSPSCPPPPGVSSGGLRGIPSPKT